MDAIECEESMSNDILWIESNDEAERKPKRNINKMIKFTKRELKDDPNYNPRRSITPKRISKQQIKIKKECDIKLEIDMMEDPDFTLKPDIQKNLRKNLKKEMDEDPDYNPKSYKKVKPIIKKEQEIKSIKKDPKKDSDHKLAKKSPGKKMKVQLKRCVQKEAEVNNKMNLRKEREIKPKKEKSKVKPGPSRPRLVRKCKIIPAMENDIFFRCVGPSRFGDIHLYEDEQFLRISGDFEVHTEQIVILI